MIERRSLPVAEFVSLLPQGGFKLRIPHIPVLHVNMHGRQHHAMLPDGQADTGGDSHVPRMEATYGASCLPSTGTALRAVMPGSIPTNMIILRRHT